MAKTSNNYSISSLEQSPKKNHSLNLPRTFLNSQSCQFHCRVSDWLSDESMSLITFSKLSKSPRPVSISLSFDWYEREINWLMFLSIVESINTWTLAQESSFTCPCLEILTFLFDFGKQISRCHLLLRDQKVGQSITCEEDGIVKLWLASEPGLVSPEHFALQPNIEGWKCS